MTNPTPNAGTGEGLASDAPATIRIRNLSKRYGNVHALDGLDLELTRGKIVGLLGENGCGKTTLMKVIAGVASDYTGDVRVCGHTPGPQSKALVSFLPDASFLGDSMRVRACIGLYRDFFDDFDVERARDLIGFFGLDESMRLKAMSKGMREKVQIALAMSRKAKLYLLDEPISGVDPAARQVILDGILRTLDDDSLLLIATHLVHDLEPVLDAVVIMRHGTTVLSGDADDLRAEHGMSIDELFRETHK